MASGRIYFSSSEESAGKQWLTAEPAQSSPFIWCAPEQLLQHAEKSNVIWLYQAPWQAALSANDGETTAEGMLTNWLASNRTILAARAKLVEHITLVNRHYSTVAEVIRTLAGTAASDTNHLSEVNPPATAMFGHLFDRAAPEYCDIFEALEAVAWLPTGRQPLFRNLIRSNRHQLHQLFDDLRTVTAAACPDQTRTEEGVSALMTVPTKPSGPVNHANDELTQENELLLSQLHLVQEELEKFYFQNLDLRKRLNSKELEAPAKTRV